MHCINNCDHIAGGGGGGGGGCFRGIGAIHMIMFLYVEMKRFYFSPAFH